MSRVTRWFFVVMPSGCLKLGEDLNDFPRDLKALFDRLVAVGICAELDTLGDIARPRQLLAEEVGRLGLEKQLGLEVESGESPR